jgi:hypothetical protein
MRRRSVSHGHVDERTDASLVCTVESWRAEDSGRYVVELQAMGPVDAKSFVRLSSSSRRWTLRLVDTHEWYTVDDLRSNRR